MKHQGIILDANFNWPISIDRWIQRVLEEKWAAVGMAIHSNGRIEVGPLVLNG